MYIKDIDDSNEKFSISSFDLITLSSTVINMIVFRFF